MTGYENHDSTQALATGLLQLAVPLWVLKFRDKTWEEMSAIGAECGQMIAEHGDHLMFRGKHTAETFNALAKAIAVLSFAPGGVTLFGQHWESKAKDEAKPYEFERWNVKELTEQMAGLGQRTRVSWDDDECVGGAC